MLKANMSYDDMPEITINGQPSVFNNQTISIPRLQPLRISMLDENEFQKESLTTEESEKGSKSSRMKLKDYLFLAQTSASKNASEKRRALENLSNKRNKTQAELGKITSKPSTALISKNKYGIEKSEMFQILKRQIQNQLKQSIEQIITFNNQFRQHVKGPVIPSSSQMMIMYKLRNLLKQKMNTCLKEMKETFQNEKMKKEQSLEIEISLDQQSFGKDIGFNQKMFNQKYLQLQQKVLRKQQHS